MTNSCEPPEDIVARLRKASTARALPPGAGIMFDYNRPMLDQLPGLLESQAAAEIETLRTQISDLVTALDRIAHEPTTGSSLIAITALHAYNPARRVLNESPLPEIDKTIKPPAKYYPERQG